MAIIDLRTNKGSEQDKLLSLAEAKSLGVPYGTSRGDAFGIVQAKSGGGEKQEEASKLLSPTEATNFKVPYGTTKGEVFGKTPINELTSGETSAINQLKMAQPIVNELKAAYASMVGKEYEGVGAGVLSRLKGLKRSVGAAVGTNQNAKIYKSLAESNLSIIARALKAEKGVLTEQDVGRARGAIAKLSSSPKEAKAVFDAIERQAANNLKILYGEDMKAADAPRASKAEQYRTEAAAAQKDADRSTTSRFLGELPKQAGRTLLETPARFLASAAAAPVDLYRTATGGQPMHGNIPVVNKPTYQAQGARDIGQLFDKAYAGEKFGVGDYAKAVRPFAEVPAAALETVGVAKLGKAAINGMGGARRLFADRKLSKEIESTMEMITPLMDKKAKIAALAQAGKPGGVARGRLGTTVRTPNKEDVEVAKAVMPFIKKKNPSASVENINEEIGRFSDDSLRPYLQANPRAYNPQTLNKKLAEVEPPDWIKADSVAERTYTLVKNRMMQAAQQHPGTMEGLWDSRVSFDQTVKQQFGDAALDPTKRAFVNRAVRDMRGAVNDFIAESTGDSQFKQAMKYLSRLFMARDNISEKYYKVVESSDEIVPLARRFKKAATWTGGVVAGTAASGIAGAGVYGAMSNR